MIRSNPYFPFHSESDRDFHAWLGLYVLNWSAFEFSLYNLLHTLGRLGIASPPQAGKPIPLKAKLKAFRAAFSSHPSLLAEKDEVFAIADFAEKEAAFRHRLIHGSKANFLKSDPWVALMWKPEETGIDPQHDKLVRITQPDIEEHYHEVGYATFAMIGLSRRIVEPWIDEMEEKVKQKQQQIDESKARAKNQNTKSD